VTAAASGGVLDSPVFIAHENGRPLDADAIPDEVATTVITLAELTMDVLAAPLATSEPLECPPLSNRDVTDRRAVARLLEPAFARHRGR
jgi:predicted nucleic acid-binding protein